ncbi:MAG: hypothetical protein QXL17_07670 [Candidatus Thermoplasmatota archaeon]
MINLNEELKKLYCDAFYFALLRQGYAFQEAQEKAQKIFNSNI